MELKEKYPVRFLCDILKVSESGYYKWLKNKDNIDEEETNSNMQNSMQQAEIQAFNSRFEKYKGTKN